MLRLAVLYEESGYGAKHCIAGTQRETATWYGSRAQFIAIAGIFIWAVCVCVCIGCLLVKSTLGASLDVLRPWKKCRFLKEKGCWSIAVISLWIRIFQVLPLLTTHRTTIKKKLIRIFLGTRSDTNTAEKKKTKQIGRAEEEKQVNWDYNFLCAVN